MTLAAIVGVCLLTASPSFGARTAGLTLAAAVEQESAAGQQPTAVEPGESNSKPLPQQQAPASSPQDKSPNPKAQAAQAPSKSTPDRGADQPQKERQKERKCSPAAHSKPAKSKRKSVSSSKTKKHHSKHPVVERKTPTSPKVVVKDGGASDPIVTISPGLNQQQASKQRQSAEELLAKAGENLKKISGHDLTSSQQEMVKQIQRYMEQAKAAGNTGDLSRQHNLALKAQLLSEELVKP